MARLLDVSAASASHTASSLFSAQIMNGPNLSIGCQGLSVKQGRLFSSQQQQQQQRQRNKGVSCTALPDTSQSSSADLMNLGRTPLRISKLGIGTLQWGDPDSGYGKQYGAEQLAGAFDALVEGGINFFDTAEVYGYQGIKNGSSAEQLLGSFLTRPSLQKAGGPSPPVIASKFFTIPWTNFLVGGGFRFGRKSLLAALRESLKRLGKKQIDLYQIHFPFPLFSNAALMESLKEAVEEGLTKAVGVSNYSKDQMEEADDILSKYGLPLASNQVQFNLLCRKPIEEGLLKSAQERGITVIAYSPLASGLLTSKTLGRTDDKAIKARPLLELLQSVGGQHGGKSVSQVALNYLIFKGALPIAGVKTPEQARQHKDTLGWQLSADEVGALEEKARVLKL